MMEVQVPATAETAKPVASQTMARDEEAEDDPVIQIGTIPTSVRIANCICFPFDLLCGWQTVSQAEVVATEYCGIVTHVRNTPGLYYQPCCGSNTRRVTTAVQTMDLPNTKIVDANGAPLMVSAIVNYQVADPLKAIYNVIDYKNYVVVNAQAVVKSVIGVHTYENLKTDTVTVNAQLKQEMQKAVSTAGVRIRSVALNELNYAPEISGSMLKKQAAGAVLEARHIIMQGAVQIAQDAVAALEKDGGMTLTNDDKVKIVTNLLTVTCSDSDAQPTINVG